MNETRKLIASFEALERGPARTADDVHALARIVLELGYHDLKSFPGFDFLDATRAVCTRYRNLLRERPSDAKCLNNLAALLLSSNQAVEGRRYARMALAAAPDNDHVHHNVAIADVYCHVARVHRIPAGTVADDSFLLAYFDPHAH